MAEKGGYRTVASQGGDTHSRAQRYQHIRIPRGPRGAAWFPCAELGRL